MRYILTVPFVSILALTGCLTVSGLKLPPNTRGEAEASVPVMPPGGLLYSNIKAPLTTDFDNTVLGSAKGKSSAVYFRIPFPFPLPLSFGFGDVSISEAMKDGGIQELRHADYSQLTVLGLFGYQEVIAYGE